MSAADIRELLDHEPFRPFRITMSGGKQYDVVDPGLAVMLKSDIFIAFPDGEHWALVPLLHVAAVEPIRNGARPPSRRKRRS